MSVGKDGAEVRYVRSRDGVRLRTHVRLPEGEGPWPVLFARSPYPGMLPYWLDTAAYWAGHGYAFVYQECRGTGGSEGEWTPFVREREDGLDSLAWIVRQPWSDGNIGTYGASYSGVAQWCMADALPPEVKTMFIAVTGIERYRQSYMNGMFRHDIYTSWAVGNAGAEPLVPRGELYREALKTRPHAEMDVRLFGRELPWYREWVTQPGPEGLCWNEGFWAEVRDVPRRTKVPILMTAGWFDHNLDATIASYGKLPEEIRAASVLIIGPWIHTSDASGDLAYPGHDAFGPGQREAALRWFDHHLKGADYGGPKGRVHVYAIGENVWKTRDGQLRLASSRRFRLSAAGRLKEAGCAGLLAPEGDNGEPGALSFDYDPERPVPTRGGAALLHYLSGDPDAAPPASVLQAPPGTRPDVLTFLSEPLDADLPIAGSMSARLTVSSDAEDTSFTVQVMEVLPDGRAFNIRDGITSLRLRNGAPAPLPYVPGEKAAATIELWPIVWTVKRGSRLRVDVSSSNFPAYHAHPNLAGIWSLQEKTKVARQTVYVGEGAETWLDVPVAEEGGEGV